MERVFLTVLNMSITSGYVICAVMLVRLLIRRAPKKYAYLLWSVVGFRMICPVSVSSVFSLFRLRLFELTAAQGSGSGTLSYVPENIGLMEAPQVTVGIEAVSEAINHNLPAANPQGSVNPMQLLLAGSTFLWIVGMAAMLLYGIIGYVMLRYRMRTAVILHKNIYQSDKVRSPFILGYLRPKIYIPFGLEERMQRYVLLHERYHLKRKDHLIRLAAYLLLTLHWFNLLCWFAFVLMGRDMEMSCDEKVLSGEKNIRKIYSTALLSFAANRRFPAPGPLAFGEAGVKKRIRNVLCWKRPKLYLTVLAITACCIVAAACATNPADRESGENAGGADAIMQQPGEEEARQSAQGPKETTVPEENGGETTGLDFPETAENENGTVSGSGALMVETSDGIREFSIGDVAVWELDADSWQTGIRLDVDGDGTMEQVYLTSPTQPRQEWERYVVEEGFDVHVDDQVVECYGSYVECAILALTLDGQRLLLGVFDEGPSGDPVTTFYRYDGSRLYAAGEVPGDIRTLSIGEDGIIPCPFRADMLQTAFATGYWYWNGEAVVRREDDEYYYVHGGTEEEFPLTLLEELPVYPQPQDMGEPVVMAPQPVREVKTDLEEGVYLQAQDGTEGWIRVRPSYLPSQGDRQATEVFEGLQYYD